MSGLEALKKIAAEKAVIDFVKNGYIIGIGSGSTIQYAVQKIAALVKENCWSVKCVPTSFQAKQLILNHGLPLVTLEEYPELDLALDGADEVDADMNLIKGGGGCLLQEKIVDCAAKQFVVIADDRKKSTRLGQNWHKGIPIEVVPMAYKLVQKKISSTWGGEPDLRQAVQKMGPLVTDNGNFLIDWKFDFAQSQSWDWSHIDNQLHMIPGVVETGLFIRVATCCYFGQSNNQVDIFKS